MNQFLKKYKFYFAFGLIFLFSLFCKYSITTDIRFSEILELLSKNFKGKKFANSKVRFGMNSLEKCEEDKEALTKILKEHFNQLNEVECKKDIEEFFLEANFQLPIIKLVNGQFDIEEGLLNLTVSKINKIKIGLFIDKEEFNELNNSIKEKYSQNLKIEDFQINFEFHNDTKSEINLYLDSVYIKGKAFPRRTKLKLQTEQIETFHLSNIMKEFIYDTSHTDFLSIDIIEKPDK